MPDEPRQRWRLTYRRRPDAPVLGSREQQQAWEVAIAASGLPAAGLELDPPRARFVQAAPLGPGVPAEAEVADLYLVEVRPVAEVRDRLTAALPSGHELIALHDVWLGSPPLPGRVAGADYRITVRRVDGDDRIDAATLVAAIDRAAAAILAAAELPRTREKAGRPVRYDLRPLVATIGVEWPPATGDVPADVPSHAATGTAAAATAAAATAAAASPGSVVLRIRTRFDPERGIGRPEEVVAALADAAGLRLEILETVRERLILADGG